MKRLKRIKVTYEKLGKEQAWGIANDHKRTIRLDERLKGLKHLEVLIHEVIHIQNPDLSETEVLQKAREMAKVLWAENYRRIDNTEKQPSS